jgi:hypothetical protein
MRFFVSFFFLLTFLYNSVAQKGYEVGGWIGTSTYFGDLNTTLMPKQLGLAGGLIGRINFNERVSVKTTFNAAKIGADDAQSRNSFERNRNLSFKSNIFNITGGLEFNFFEYEHGSYDKWYTPFLFGGLEMLSFNPKALHEGTWVKLRDLGTEGQGFGDEYGSLSAAFVIGGGFKWDINKDWSFNVEFATRKLFTDYIDDVSTTYVDKGALTLRRGPLAAALADRSLIDGIGVAGRQRGNSRDNDTYVTFGIGIVRYFGELACPKISDF